MKTNRKLTDKQLFALDCIKKGRVVAKQVHNTFVRHWADGVTVWEYFAIDSNITNQIKSLRRRGLVIGSGERLRLTARTPCEQL